MRIITVFTVFVIIFFGAFPASARENKDYSFSLCPQFGLLNGHVEEIVYPTDTKAPLLSLLLWDVKPVFYYGLLMDFSPVRPVEKSGFFSELSLKFGIPGRSGVMEDKDWMSKVNTDLTNYSKHDNITKEIFLLDFKAGVLFPVFNALLVKTFVNISYMNFRFSGENGHGTYANENQPEKTFSGKVIGYKQEWFFAAPGVSLGYGYKNYFFAEISFIATPLVLCTGLDGHIERNIQFKDNMTGGWLLEPGFRYSMNLTERLGVSWEISWRYIKGTRGPSYNRQPIGSGNYHKDGEAGAGMSMLNTALLLKVRL